jgi:hypothetical protein
MGDYSQIRETFGHSSPQMEVQLEKLRNQLQLNMLTIA